jgi:glycosyltransferase involved in cell wall biosynthesis
MHMLRAIDRERFRMDFMVHLADKGMYDDEVRSLGSKVIRGPDPAGLRHYGKGLRRLLREHGPYDVVHSHVYDFSGLVLKHAARAGVPGRIAHSHTDLSQQPSERTLRRRAYRSIMGHWIRRYATAGIGISEPATRALFGEDWRNDPRWRIIHYGIDLSPFEVVPDSAAVRTELGLPSDAKVVGHVGNFLPVKNHMFLLRAMVEVISREPMARLVLIGQGELRDSIAAEAERLGIRAKVVFAGVRSDVPRLLMGAVDVLAFPSLYEGLGLAVVEAQAAGIFSVISTTVPREAIVLPDLVSSLPLNSTTVWADALLAGLNSTPPIGQRDALAAVASSPFRLAKCVETLGNLYESYARRSPLVPM